MASADMASWPVPASSIAVDELRERRERAIDAAFHAAVEDEVALVYASASLASSLAGRAGTSPPRRPPPLLGA